MNDPIAKEKSEYFTLGDLWDCYEEWSSYGIGAPIALKNNENVVQYYAPYLSAIQIYTIKSPTTLRYYTLILFTIFINYRTSLIIYHNIFLSVL